MNSSFQKFIQNNSYKHLLYWTTYVLFFALIWGSYDQSYFRNIMIQLLGLPSRLILVYVTLWGLVPFYFLRKKYIEFVLSYILLLTFCGAFLQRATMFFIVQPIYLPEWKSHDFFALTEVMNTILDVNLAAVIPVGYAFFKIWSESQERNAELEEIYQELSQTKTDDFLYLKSEKSLQKVFIKDIIFIESLKNYIKVKTNEREIIAYKSLSAIEEELPVKQFIRVHRSYIVSRNFIDSFSPTQVDLKGTIIPIGRKYKSEVVEALGYF